MVKTYFILATVSSFLTIRIAYLGPSGEQNGSKNHSFSAAGFTRPEATKSTRKKISEMISERRVESINRRITRMAMKKKIVSQLV